MFFHSLNHYGASSATLYQIESSDYFYAPYYFSDGNISDINIYYVRSKKLQNAISQKGNTIKFIPGTGDWEPHNGELKEIYAWLFILRVTFTSSMEIQEIYNLEKEFERCCHVNQTVVAE